MKMLNPNIDIDTFFSNLRKGTEKILVLDYDGTIAPFKVERDKAFPDKKIVDLLKKIVKSRDCTVAIVSGRKAKEIARLLPDLNNRIEIWGSHGWEHIELDGSYSNSRPAPEVLKAIEDAAKKVNGDSLKGRIERKDASIAIHTRGLEKKEQKEIKDKVVPEWKDIASAEGMSLVRFNGGYELRDKSINKGSVIREIIEKSGKNGIICYIGDDSTDEDAFAELKDRGLSILISYEDPISSNADVKFDSMDELIDFLKRWSRACGGER